MKMTPEELIYWCEKLKNVLTIEKASIDEE